MSAVPRPGEDAVPLHRRAIDYRAWIVDDDLVVVGRLTDTRPWAGDGGAVATVHDLELRVRVRSRTSPSRAPPPRCTRSPMRSVRRSRRPSPDWSGSTWPAATRGEVQARFGGPRGCTHLEHLARSLGPVVIQAVTSRRAQSVSRGESPDLLAAGGGTGSPWARDSCHIWAEGSVADQKLAAGWRPGTGPYPAPALVTFLERPGRMSVRRAVTAGVVLAVAVLALGVQQRHLGPLAVHHFAARAPARSGVRDHDRPRGRPRNRPGGRPGPHGLHVRHRRPWPPSRCYDISAVQWPPVVLKPGVTRPVAGPGIDTSLLGTSPRTDGTTQVTYNGWPLYLWPPDRARARPPARRSPTRGACGTSSPPPASRS